MEGFKIGVSDMDMIYMSPDSYHKASEQTVDLRKFDMATHHTGGLNLFESDGRVHLASISPSTPTARIHDWCTRIRGAWLVKVDTTPVANIADVTTAFTELRLNHAISTTLLFSHPEIRPSLSQNGTPIVSSAPFSQLTHDQLNNRWEFLTVVDHLQTCKPSYEIVDSGDPQCCHTGDATQTGQTN